VYCSKQKEKESGGEQVNVNRSDGGTEKKKETNLWLHYSWGRQLEIQF